MRKLADALASWAPNATRGPTAPLAMLEATWEEIVGAEVARHSSPVRVSEGILTVATRSSAWSHQLSFLSDRILHAVAARSPNAGIRSVRFRVGRLSQRACAAPMRSRVAPVAARPEPTESANAAEALARFRSGVESQRRALRAQGRMECPGCRAPRAPGAAALCSACQAARRRRLESATARLLFEAPWLGCAGTIALVAGLREEEYERIRTQVLAHWWRLLARARATKQLSRDGRERLVASSYVLLQSRLSPEEILPATVRSILGEELHDLLYGEA